MIIPARRTRLSSHGRVAALVGALSAFVGALVALRDHRLGLTLSHYDARGHLIVARRIIDSITPGWQQIGAVWLPLPHLLNAIPIQVDLFYRTGASAVALSTAAFALASAAIASIVLTMTGSAAAAIAGASVFVLNPNILYLQATPMSEPLLFALLAASVALLIHPGYRDRPAICGVTLALACLTRYEAWPVTSAALAAVSWAKWRRGEALKDAARAAARIGLYPSVAIVGFAIFSRIVVGHWFVSGGFFVPENTALGHPREALNQIAWGVGALSGSGLVAVAAIGASLSFVIGVLDRQRGDRLIPLSLLATAAVPWAAFVDGHPYRIRYVTPLIVIEAVGAGYAAGTWKRGRPIAGALLALLVAMELRPFDVAARMPTEAQWDRPNFAPRQHVADCLRAGYDGTSIMASMGSLGHYMQQLSYDGFDVRDFLHEGNGDIWLAALDGPRPFAGWLLMEEKAEGGDMLAKVARVNPHFLDGFTPVCDGAGLALYRRNQGAVGPNP